MTTESEDPKEIGWNTVDALTIADLVNSRDLAAAAQFVGRIREQGRKQGLKEAQEIAKAAKTPKSRRGPKTTK